MQSEYNVDNRATSNSSEGERIAAPSTIGSSSFGAPALGQAPAVVRPPVEVDVSHASTAASGQTEPNGAALKLAAELNHFQAVAEGIASNLQPADSFDARCDQAFTLSTDLFGHAPTWVCFFREVMTAGGLLRRIFPTPEEYDQFMTTSHYDQVQQMITGLRSRDLPENDPKDPQRMITVRLPKSLHEALVEEAERLGISVNKLCISRLLQVLDHKMVPETGSKPRGRKPRSRTQTVAVTTAASGQ